MYEKRARRPLYFAGKSVRSCRKNDPRGRRDLRQDAPAVQRRMLGFPDGREVKRVVFYRPMTHASIEGAIARVERRGKSLYCFEGTELRKIGHGELIRVDVDGTRYVGELVAIGPT